MEAVKNKTVNRSATAKPAASSKQLQTKAGNGHSSVALQLFAPKISSPKDPAEKEANATAQKVMRMTMPESSHPSVINSSGSIFRQTEEEETVQPKLRSPYIARFAESGIFRQTEEEEMVQPQVEEEEQETAQRQVEQEEPETAQRQVEQEEPEETVQTKANGQSHTVAANVAADISSSKATGSPLPTGVRQFMEPRFNADFSNVKIHTDHKAAQFNQQLNAKAFTLGSHIFFAKDTFKPDSYDGKELMAHELTHTIQQGAAIQRRTEESPPSSPNPESPSPAETESATAATIATPKPPTGSKSEAAVAITPESTVESEAPTSVISDTAEVPEAMAPETTEEPIEEGQPEMTPEETTEAKTAEEVPTEMTSEETTEAKAAKEVPKGKAAKGKAKKAEAAGAGALEVSSAEKAPASPEEDPAFQAVVKKAKGVAAGQRKHAPAKAKAKEAQDAAEEPANAIESKAQANQVEEMEKSAAKPPAFDAVAFKDALKERIKETAPKNLKEADNFKKNNKLGAVKGEMTSKVKDEKAASQKPLEEKTQQVPDKSSIEAKTVTKLPPAEPGKAPPKIGAEQAAPKPKTPSEIEAPLQQDSQALDQQMATENITEEQLAKSNEPDFQGALDSKKEAQTHAVEDPLAYRQAEQVQLTQAQAQSAISSKKQLQGMHGDRAKQLMQVESKQGKAKSKDEQARIKIANDLQAIYLASKTKVETILSELDGKVESAFDKGAEKAKAVFEDYVGQRMRRYKSKRYSGVRGLYRWGRDKIRGLPNEVNVFYKEGRDLYLQKMDGVLDTVITIIGTELTNAKTEIALGRKEIQKYVANLPKDLQKVGQEAASDIENQFDDLENSVNSKQDALIDTLARKYQENLKAVDERIEKMKEANKGLIDKAIGAIKAVINAIRKIKALFAKILARIAEVIGLILQDPIGFFKNLMTGLKQGFNNFVSNIGKHLQAGLIVWLTGTLGPVGIQIPDDLLSLKGIFSLVMQILGLTWDYIRKKAVKMFGEPVVAAMEKSVEIFQVIQRDGPAGLWEYVKEEFSNLKEMVMDQIQEMVTTEIIKAGVKWVLSLLNPVAAFIKAAMAIYNIVMFFVERAAQIADFLNSIIDAVAAIAKGAVGGAAQLVEAALAKSIPLIIGMLAALLGISGIANKVQKIIQRIRKRIDKAIDKLLKKARKAFKKIFGRKKITKEDLKKSKKENKVDEREKSRITDLARQRIKASMSRRLPAKRIIADLNKLKTKNRWIKRFEVRKLRNGFAIHMIASDEKVGDIIPHTTDTQRPIIDEYVSWLARYRTAINKVLEMWKKKEKPGRIHGEANRVYRAPSQHLDRIENQVISSDDTHLMTLIESLFDERKQLDKDAEAARKNEPSSSTTGETMSHEGRPFSEYVAVKQAQLLVGKTVEQVKSSLSKLIKPQEHHPPAKEQTGGRHWFNWKFKDKSSIRLDIPGIYIDSKWQVSREPHIVALGPRGEVLSRQGIDVPALSEPAHQRIFR